MLQEFAPPREQKSQAQRTATKRKPHEIANGSARQFDDVSGRAVASESTIGDTAVVGMIGCVRKNVEGAESWYTAAHGRGRSKVTDAPRALVWPVWK